jgi:hypothetical protein
MQHFTAALLLADVVIKLHALALVAIVEQQRPGLGSSLAFDLSRASSTGTWVQSLQRAVSSAQPFGMREEPAAWVMALKTWLTQRRRREDEERLTPVLSAALEFVDALKRDAGESASRDGGKTPADLMSALVEIRNKTTGHRAYGAEFWARHTATVSEAVAWIADESPLWRSSLLLPVSRQGRTVCRLLETAEPTSSVSVPGGLDLSPASTPLLALDDEAIASLGPLIFVDAATNLTYIANGTWRDSDSSAEFLCHSLEASDPAHGTIRQELTAYAIKPRELAASETQGEAALLTASGMVMNNLPADVEGYVQRGELEERMRSYLFDARRRHVINVRGPGGFGKTSLLLRLCHELVSDVSRSPYAAVVWMSARDVDLTMAGAVPVRRSEESIEDVWVRFAALFGEEVDPADARDFFETSMREEAILLVLDNFETFNDQEASYAYLDELVQPPAKTIITSRHVFTGDSPIEVRGMSQDEADQLLVGAARTAGVEPLMSDRVRGRIFERCQGHPYAMKLIASQVRSEAGLTGLLTSVIRNEDLLDALFRGSLEDLGNDDDAVFVFLLVGQFAAGLSEQALRVAAEPDSIDVDRALGALRKRSLVDIVRGGGAPRYDMPAMAREFAQRHLVGHLLRTEVEGTADFLRRWPALIDGRTSEAAEMMLAEVVNREDDSLLRQRTVSALRVLTSFDEGVWVDVARAERAVGSAHDVWENAYKRAVEAAPDRADLLYEWSEVSPEPDRQVELKVQAVRADPRNVALASRVANFLNGLYARDRDRYQPVRWSALMGAVIQALEASFAELDGEALSRLAWLYIHAGRSNDSRRVIERGLAVDFENQSLRRLATRQQIRF